MINFLFGFITALIFLLLFFPIIFCYIIFGKIEIKMIKYVYQKIYLEE